MVLRKIAVYCCAVCLVGCLVQWHVRAVEVKEGIDGMGEDVDGAFADIGTLRPGIREAGRALKAVPDDRHVGYISESMSHFRRKLSEANGESLMDEEVVDEGPKDEVPMDEGLMDKGLKEDVKKKIKKEKKSMKKKGVTREDKSVARGNARTVAVRYGFIATIRREDSHLCVGVLVDYSTVLTVASCVDPRLASRSLANPTVWVGAIKNDAEDEGMEVRKTKLIKLHPKWTGVIRGGYDIAALQLDKPIEKHIPIRIANPSIEGFILAKKVGLGLIGYGRTAANSALPPYARIGFLDYIPTDTCNEKYYNGVVSAEMMCAGETESEACPGDEGAPLFLQGANEKRDVLLGLASVVNANCGFRSERPGVFTRISTMVDFIDEAIDEFA